MPITVACSCGAKLRAPDAAAGKRVKCPKCANPVPVPAAEADFEMIDDDPPPAPVKKKPMLVDDDEDAPRSTKRPVAAAVKRKPVEVDEPVVDEEDEEEERPKKTKVKRRVGKNREEEKKKRTLRLILGIGGAVTVLGVMVGVIVVVVSMINNDPSKAGLPTTTTPPKPVLPAGWSTFKGDGFSVGVPDAVQFKQQDLPAGAGGPRGQVTAGTKAYTNGVQPQPGQPVWLYTASVVPLPEKDVETYRQNPDKGWREFRAGLEATAGQVDEGKPFTAGGLEGREYRLTIGAGIMSGVLRAVVKGDRVYTWAVISQNQPVADDPNVKPFFDTFKIE